MGRGTATYDGLALAWATLEYLHSVTRAKTLFATHYHELTALGEDLPLVKNYRVSIKETPAGIVFLRPMMIHPWMFGLISTSSRPASSRAERA